MYNVVYTRSMMILKNSNLGITYLNHVLFVHSKNKHSTGMYQWKTCLFQCAIYRLAYKAMALINNVFSGYIPTFKLRVGQLQRDMAVLSPALVVIIRARDDPESMNTKKSRASLYLTELVSTKKLSVGSASGHQAFLFKVSQSGSHAVIPKYFTVEILTSAYIDTYKI